MKTRHPVAPPDDRTISVHMASGAVVRIRPSELVGWAVGGRKPKRRNLIDFTEQIKAESSRIIGAKTR